MSAAGRTLLHPLLSRAGAALALAALLSGSAFAEERVERRLLAMGTELELAVLADTRAEALSASEAAVAALAVVEARLSTWRPDSELARLNRARVGEPVELSAELAAELERARYWTEQSGGAFDPGIGALVAAFGLRGGGRIPGDAELAAARAGSGLAQLRLADGHATRLSATLVLDEGGFGKGVGLDAALRAALASGARSVVLDLGGQVALAGAREPQAFPLADPRERARAVLSIAIEHGSLATSGNSERGVVVDGRRIGHVLDPRTGEPAPDFGSVTVWAADATDADCLSTALFVLGPDAALAFAAAEPDVEALVLTVGPDGLVARATPGLRGRIAALVPDLLVHFEAPPPADSPAALPCNTR